MSDTTVTLKLQAPVIERLQAIAALAGVTFDQAAAVILAVEVCGSPLAPVVETVAQPEKPQPEKKFRKATVSKDELHSFSMRFSPTATNESVARAFLESRHGFDPKLPFKWEHDDHGVTFTQEIK